MSRYNIGIDIGITIGPNAPLPLSASIDPTGTVLTVTFSQPVTATGNGGLSMSDGATLTYLSGSGTNTLTLLRSTPALYGATPTLAGSGSGLTPAVAAFSGQAVMNNALPTPPAMTGLQLWDVASAGLSTDGAVSFVAASSQCLSISSLTNAPTGTAGTIAVWTTPNGSQTGSWIISLGNGVTGGVSINISGASLYVQGGISGVGSTAAFAMTSGVAYLLILTWTATGISFYVNGSLIGSFSGSVTIPNTTLNIGSYQGVQQYFNGTVSQVAIWGRVLSSTDMTNLYKSGAGLAYENWPSSLLTSLVSEYPFYQPGNLGQDRFGANTLTLNNAPTYVAGNITGTPSQTGDAVSAIADQSTNANSATQATGASRGILTLNKINGKPTIQGNGIAGAGFYSLASNIVLSGPFTLYDVINYNGSSLEAVMGSQSPGGGIGILNPSCYFRTDSGQVGPATTPTTSGAKAYRWRRDASNIAYVAFTGQAEQVIGTLSGNITLAEIMGYGSGHTMTNTDYLAELFITNTDTVANGQDTSIARPYILAQYGLTIP